jgi:hypothetical protein
MLGRLRIMTPLDQTLDAYRAFDRNRRRILREKRKGKIAAKQQEINQRFKKRQFIKSSSAHQ